MAIAGPLPHATDAIERKLFRYVTAHDPIPALPAKPWGPFVHVGQEYRLADGRWQRSESPVAQLSSMREIPRAVLAFFASEKRAPRLDTRSPITDRTTNCRRRPKNSGHESAMTTADTSWQYRIHCALRPTAPVRIVAIEASEAQSYRSEPPRSVQPFRPRRQAAARFPSSQR